MGFFSFANSMNIHDFIPQTFLHMHYCIFNVVNFFYIQSNRRSFETPAPPPPQEKKKKLNKNKYI